MAKLSKAQTKAHNEALEILQKDVLTFDNKWDVLDKYHEGANHMQGMAGAFFTPPGLARDFAIDACGGKRVLDLCAGIGNLAFHVMHRQTSSYEADRAKLDYVCIEQCAEYVEIVCVDFDEYRANQAARSAEAAPEPQQFAMAI